MDGPSMISQPPIDAGSSFDYIFSARQSGTFWYHAHFGGLRTDGLYGGLVIRSSAISDAAIVDDPGKYTLSLINWNRESSANVIDKINSSLGFFPNKMFRPIKTLLILEPILVMARVLALTSSGLV